MKQVAVFFILLFIGVVGGFAATELKSLFGNGEANSSAVNSNAELTVSELRKSVEKLEDEVESLNETINNQNAVIAELSEIQDTPQPNDNATSEESSPVVNQNMQQQLNELRGQIKALEQKMNDRPKSVSPTLINPRELSAEEKAKREVQLKQVAEAIRKKMDEGAVKHADKMKKVLKLTDGQYEEIKAALFEKNRKQSESFYNGSSNSSNSSVEIMERSKEIQNEWEESAKNILTPEQHEIFMKKRLNQVSGSMFFKIDDGSFDK